MGTTSEMDRDLRLLGSAQVTCPTCGCLPGCLCDHAERVVATEKFRERMDRIPRLEIQGLVRWTDQRPPETNCAAVSAEHELDDHQVLYLCARMGMDPHSVGRLDDRTVLFASPRDLDPDRLPDGHGFTILYEDLRPTVYKPDTWSPGRHGPLPLSRLP